MKAFEKEQRDLTLNARLGSRLFGSVLVLRSVGSIKRNY